MENKSLEEQKQILESLEAKNILYKIKRWERNLLKYLRNLFNKDNRMKEHIEIMEKQNEEFNKEIEKENNNYENLRKEIIEETNKAINLIEQNKNEKIDENKKKYNDIITYLESIKDDKEKLIEFFNKSNLFKI